MKNIKRPHNDNTIYLNEEKFPKKCLYCVHRPILKPSGYSSPHLKCPICGMFYGIKTKEKEIDKEWLRELEETFEGWW